MSNFDFVELFNRAPKHRPNLFSGLLSFSDTGGDTSAEESFVLESTRRSSVKPSEKSTQPLQTQPDPTFKTPDPVFKVPKERALNSISANVVSNLSTISSKRRKY